MTLFIFQSFLCDFSFLFIAKVSFFLFNYDWNASSIFFDCENFIYLFHNTSVNC